MRRSLPSLSCLLLLFACATPEEPYDYTNYLAHIPRSILVLPPLDETPEVNACYGWLSTVTS